MKLESLFYLHRSMENQGIDRYRFEYSHGRAKFDVFRNLSMKMRHLLQQFTVAPDRCLVMPVC